MSIWSNVFSFLDPDYKAVSCIVCKEWRQELEWMLYAEKHVTLREDDILSGDKVVKTCKANTFPNMHDFARHVKDQVLHDDVDPWTLYEKRIRVGINNLHPSYGLYHNSCEIDETFTLELIITKIRGALQLPYIYSIVFLQENTTNEEFTMMQVYYDPSLCQFQHVKHAHKHLRKLHIPMMLLYIAYWILGQMYTTEEHNVMGSFQYNSRPFSSCTQFYKDTLPRWFDKIMSSQSIYSGVIIRDIVNGQVKI